MHHRLESLLSFGCWCFLLLPFLQIFARDEGVCVCVSVMSVPVYVCVCVLCVSKSFVE